MMRDALADDAVQTERDDERPTAAATQLLFTQMRELARLATPSVEIA